MWSKGFLITFWVIQYLAVILGWILGAFAAYVANIFNDYDDDELSSGVYDTDVKRILDASAAIWLIFSSIACILTIIETFTFSRRNLKAGFAVCSYCVKVIMWLVLLIISLGGGTAGDGIRFIVLVVFVILHLIPLIYVSVIYHRFRKGRYTQEVAYTPAANHPTALQPDVEDGGYGQQYRQPASSIPPVPTSYVGRDQAYEPYRGQQMEEADMSVRR